MSLIELNIVTLTHSVSKNNSYAVVLQEKGGDRKLPIIIGGFEAQSIAIALENMPTGRPLTHDLFKMVFDEISIELQSVVIKDLVDGVFYAVLQCRQGNELFEVDSRSSDAIALAARFGCPIFTTNKILIDAGIYEEEQFYEEEIDEDQLVGLSSKPTSLDDYSIQKLEELMEESLKNENYEQAAKIRDAIDRKQS